MKTIALETLILAAAYVVLGRLGLAFATVTESVTLIWPPTGLAVAAVLVRGWRGLPGLALGALLTNLSTGAPLVFCLATMVGNVLPAGFARLALTRWPSFDRRLGRLADVVPFAVLGAFLACTLSAGVGTLGLLAADMLPASAAGRAWTTWWLGDAMGALLFGSFLLVADGWRDEAWPAGRRVEAVVLAGALVVVGFGIYATDIGRSVAYPLSYLAFPLIVWAASRFRQHGAATATLIITVASVAGLVGGRGPFAQADLQAALLYFNGFLSVLSLIGLALGAAASERRRSRAALARTLAGLEQEIAARTEELTRSNRELENFAYVASHDLKAPLRGIRHIVDWLGEDLGPRLDGDNREHLALLSSRVGRMERLLDALLAYARIGRRPERVTRVDTARLVADLEQMLQLPEGFSLATEGLMPVFETEETAFEHVLRNLIDNAIKHHDRDHGTVVVSAADLGDLYEFRVADDGPGIPPRYHDRVFTIFQTLRPRDEVEATGMGLALVKKQIEVHGGSIRIDSVEGERGTTVRFTWPKTPPA